jgi:glycosyltransferase involved in cell wall biosynthesis
MNSGKRGIVGKVVGHLRDDGIFELLKISIRYIRGGMYRRKTNKPKRLARDVLFVVGTDVDYVNRYRVDHPIEELTANGMTADRVQYYELTLDELKYYHAFVFYRCPILPIIKEFIKLAKANNKVCFFSVDDLVIDTKYTDTLEVVKKMPASDKEKYDNGVRRMRATMDMCDYGMATTERLAEELEKNGLKDVFIDRNVASDGMIKYSKEAVETVNRDPKKIVIGYFSGSATHNGDFMMIAPALLKIMKKYNNVYLKIGGFLDLPKDFNCVGSRVMRMAFKKNWRELPAEIAECDMNIAPLEHSIFNEAKSEIKWLEAALVKVPTVASRIGAFARMIDDGRTGILVEDNEGSWFGAMERLVRDEKERREIGEAAYDYVMANRTTIMAGYELVKFIRSKLAPNVAFVLPSTNLSGGILVALKHAEILKKNGFDVSIIDIGSRRDKGYSVLGADFMDNILYPEFDRLELFFDNMVATMWVTLGFVKSYAKKGRVSYLVQNFETDFYRNGERERLLANSTYADCSDVKYLTISKWCQSWLMKGFGKRAALAGNGLDVKKFTFRKRNFRRKIKILIEGDSKSEYKNVDESFRVVNALDANKYEVSYLSYNGKPKAWYRVDYFYSKVSPDKVGKVYGEHDILLKSSWLESFSYPPLEMMATGGIVVAVKNGGNAEYLRDGENCLIYKLGEIGSGVKCIERIVSDKRLRDKIVRAGVETAKDYDWKKKWAAIVALYR